MNATNPKGWLNISKPEFKGTQRGRAIYVAQDQFFNYKKIKVMQKGNYELTELWRSILSLNANAAAGDVLNMAATSRRLERNGVAILYFINNGNVFIENLEFNNDYEKIDDIQYTGLYKTERAKLKWRVINSKEANMELTHKWVSNSGSSEHYAAVSGKFPNKQRAGSQLIKHIEKAYAGVHLTDDSHYSLYWVNKKEHKKQDSVDGLARLIQQANHKKSAVNWLVHGEGTATFTKALEQLKATNKQGSAESSLALQNVYFSNPVGGNKQQLEKACKQAGLTFLNANINNRNLRGRAGINNVAGHLLKIGSAAVIAGGTEAVSKASGFSALEKAGQAVGNFTSSLVNQPTLATSAAVVAAVAVAGFAVYESKNKVNSVYRAAKAIGVCTFGRGNEYWYENDEQLFETMSV